MTKVVAIIPIGPLDKMGYQYHWKLAVYSFAQVFDKVFLVTTTAENIGLALDFDNVEVVVEPTAIFAQNNEGDEIFDVWKIYNAIGFGALMAKDYGYDFAFVGSINSVIAIEDRAVLYDYLEYLAKKRCAIGWSRRSFVLGNVVFNENAIIPNIYNLNYINKMKLGIDCISNGIFKFKITKYYGFKIAGCPIFYDLLGAETESDFVRKYEWYEENYRIQLSRPGKKKQFQDHIDKLARSVLANCTVMAEKHPKIVTCASDLFVSDSVARQVEQVFFQSNKRFDSQIKLYVRKIYIKFYMWMSTILT
ncbi:hypothetical protein E3V39_11800 [Gammaproteobacteria bacterium LSUCC0112]|nr:hypothetical protein E3V39_11800 [Gammaproteobacteria bacterium LSUCC0112]